MMISQTIASGHITYVARYIVLSSGYLLATKPRKYILCHIDKWKSQKEWSHDYSYLTCTKEGAKETSQTFKQLALIIIS